MIGGELDGPLVQRREEGFGKGHFGHGDFLEAGVERVVFGEESQGWVCMFMVVKGYGSGRGDGRLVFGGGVTKWEA